MPAEPARTDDDGAPFGGGSVGGGALTLAGALLGAALTLLAEALVARSLGTVGYGSFAVGLAVLRIGERLGTAGLPIALQHFGPAWPAAGLQAMLVPLHRWALALMGAAAVGYGVVATALIAATSAGGSSLVLVALMAVLGVPALCAVDYFGSLGRALGASWPYVAARNLAQPSLFVVLAGVLAWLASGPGGGGAIAMLLAWVASAWVAAGVAFAAAGRIVRGVEAAARPGAAPGPIDRRQMLRFAAPAWVVTVLYAALAWGDLLLVSALMPGAAAGLYRAAVVPTVVFDLFTLSINAVMARRFAQLHHAGDAAALGRAVDDSVRTGLVGASVAALLVAAHAPAILSLIGPDFAAGRDVLLWLTPAMALHGALGPLGLLLVMTGRHRPEAGCVALALAVLVLATLLLAPTFGLVGAAAAKLLAVVTLAAMRLRLLPAALRPHGALAAAAGCALVASVAVLLLYGLTWPLRGTVALLSAALLGGGALLLFGWLGWSPGQRLLIAQGWASLVARLRERRTP